MLSSVLCVTLYADVAPPVFPGYSPSLFESKEVRMKSERIDIYYGKTCKIEAVYEILNPTNKAVEKKIGFPFKPDGAGRRRGDTCTIYDFVMNLNGENQKTMDAHSDGQILSDSIFQYGWSCRFKPGLNLVKLTYHTVPSFGNSGYQWEKTLYYNLNSVNKWPGKIDNVQVTVHFPERIGKRQVLAETSPSGYQTKEKEICWLFTSVTPTSKNNIRLHIIDFKVFADLLKYEKVLSAPVTDNVTKLNAAKFFASLAPAKGINMSAPTHFKRSYYDKTVLPNLKSTELVLFNATYNLNKGTGFEDYYFSNSDVNFYQNDSLQNAVIVVMKRIGYFEKVQYPVIYKYIEGAKRLFREIVTSEPKNAAAWIAYIDNYYYIESSACSPCLPWARSCDCPESQKLIVREAFQQCRNDSIIALWHNYLFPTNVPLPPTLNVVNYEGSRLGATIEIKTDEYSGSLKELSSDELNLLLKAYKRSSNGNFFLKNTSPDNVTHDKLVEMLGGCALYQSKFCHDLKELQKHGK
jgi:hypothetical protein